MSRMPIIMVGQVYLHTTLNEYVVVTKSNRGDVYFAGKGISGKMYYEDFLEQFPPVDPMDLTPEETTELMQVLSADSNLLIGWIGFEDELEDEDEPMGVS